MKAIIRTILYVISYPVFSRLFGMLVRIKHPKFLVAQVIDLYQKSFRIDMDEFEGDVTDYDSLADFFVRKLDEKKRPLEPRPEFFLSPADGILTEWERITGDRAVQVKGITYKISELLESDIGFDQGWYVFTVYLSPADYHRFHTPVDCVLDAWLHTGGRLYPVNSLSVTTVQDLFVKNERIVCAMSYEKMKFYYVAVGATFVGGIKMVFIDKDVKREWVTSNRKFSQNDEFGRFDMGSTIILVTPEKMVESVTVKKGQRIKTGDPLFKMRSGLQNLPEMKDKNSP